MKSGEKHIIDDLPGGGHRVHHRRDVALVIAREERVVVLDALAAERGGIVDPLDVASATRDELVEVWRASKAQMRGAAVTAASSH